MGAWSIMLLLALARCSEESNPDPQKRVIYDGYPFVEEVEIPDLKNSSLFYFNTTKVAFVAHTELFDGGFRMEGIPLQDPNEKITVDVELPHESYSFEVHFEVQESGDRLYNCSVYPAAEIEVAVPLTFDRTEIYEFLKRLSEQIDYPMKLMKFTPPWESHERWNIRLMALEKCARNVFDIDFWRTINRVVFGINDSHHKLFGTPTMKARMTRQFLKKFRNIERQLDPVETKRALPVDLSSISKQAAIITLARTEVTLSTTTGTTTTEGPSAQSDEVLLSTEATSPPDEDFQTTLLKPTEAPTSTAEPSTPATEAPTTTTEAPTTTTEALTTTTEAPTTTAEAPTTKAEVRTTTAEAPTTTTMASKTTTQVFTSAATLGSSTAATDSETTPVSDGPPLPANAEIAISSEEETEVARGLDAEDVEETLQSDDSGASVAKPLFAIIVLLAIAAAVAVFTIARSRNDHRGIFVIGNASQEEINDVVVLGANEGFN